MGNVMSINGAAVSGNEVPDMSGKLADPDSEAGGARSQTPGVIAIDVRVFVIAKPVHLICDILSDAS